MARNADDPVWTRCEARRAAMTAHGKTYLRAREGGRPGNRHEWQAAQEAVRLSNDVPARSVVTTVLALYLMAELQPRRFKSDRAFQHQLVRRVRGLSDLNAGQWFDHSTGKVKRAYKDIPPKAVAYLARWLVDALGAAGLAFARAESNGGRVSWPMRGRSRKQWGT